ncbi:MAG: hypothetical protein KJZ75_11470 [Hyphomonadaceae bacterium]|nr:hypothetical protein [Hyphomonadaceae bacterium]
MPPEHIAALGAVAAQLALHALILSAVFGGWALAVWSVLSDGGRDG